MTLIERLEAAEAGSRELDCEMGLFARTDGKGEVSDHFGTPCIRDAGGPYAPKPYTTSLDAALALAERVFPEADVYVGRVNGKWDADCEPKGCDRSARFVDHEGATPALALCIAILKAKEAEK